MATQVESNRVVFDQDPSPSAEGPVRIWSLPDPNERYVIGADVAEGLEHGDYSDASVLAVGSGELVAKFHARIEAYQSCFCSSGSSTATP